MSSSGTGKEMEGDFLLAVSGSTRFATYLTGWQEFKDSLRTIVKEQPGWTDVCPSQTQPRGEMQAWCRLRHKADAEAAYGTC